MPKNKLTKYDIAISFTEKDKAVANQMAIALGKKGFDVYFYKNENQLGKDLDRVTKRVYGTGSNYGLVILSKEYRKKKWTMREWNSLRHAKKKGYIKNIFIIRLDEQRNLPGLKPSFIHERWENNPKEIAQKIKGRINYPPSRILKYIMILIIVALLILGVYYSITLKIFNWSQ